MKLESIHQAVDQYLDDRKRDFFALSRKIFDHPEVSLQEDESARRLCEILERNQFVVETGVADLDTAFRAEIKGNDEGPTVAFLLEYDALQGIGHGCGHNFIAATGMAASLALGHLMPDLPGCLVVLGTPAEETIGGKVIMVEEGVFDEIDAAMMIHPSQETRVLTTSLASHPLIVDFYGQSAHAAASPDQGINALDAVIQLFIALSLLKKQLRDDVRLPGVITEGGIAPNIIPDHAQARFSIRAKESAYLETVVERVHEIIEAVAKSTGTTFKIWADERSYEEMITNRTLAGVFRGYLVEAGIEANDTPRERMGSLDMGSVSRRVPSIHPFIQVCDPDIAGHTKAFGEATISPRGEQALLIAARSLAKTGVDFLTQKELQKRVGDEFREAVS